MIRTLLAQVRQYRKAALLAPLFTALEVLMEVLIPFVTAAIIDQGIQAGNMGQVYRYGLLMLALALVSLCAGVLAGRFRPGPRRGSPATCGTPCTAMCRPFRFPTSTSFPPQGWSPA